mmetsp:Transcript_10942/g.34733  ORF Transcript_10942/g.34733 Transcript_10942/m.34733 type:complete len:200 (+) Transcript_10942:314-913(+)
MSALRGERRCRGTQVHPASRSEAGRSGPRKRTGWFCCTQRRRGSSGVSSRSRYPGARMTPSATGGIGCRSTSSPWRCRQRMWLPPPTQAAPRQEKRPAAGVRSLPPPPRRPSPPPQPQARWLRLPRRAPPPHPPAPSLDSTLAPLPPPALPQIRLLSEEIHNLGRRARSCSRSSARSGRQTALAGVLAKMQSSRRAWPS